MPGYHVSQTSTLDDIHAVDQAQRTGNGPDLSDVHVDSNFKIVNAFEMPPWRFDGVTGNFKL